MTVLWALLFTAAQAWPACLDGFDLRGGDLEGGPVEGTPEDCERFCVANATCTGYSHHKPSPCSDHGEQCQFKIGCCRLKTDGDMNPTQTEHTDSMFPNNNICSCSALLRIPKQGPRLPPLPASMPRKPRNVLYVLVDDLRPELPGPYCHNFVHAPNLKALQESGTTFRRAYCQIAVCSPSRMSFLTGRRPTTTRTMNFMDHFRQADCGIHLPNTKVVRGEELEKISVNDNKGGSGQCCTHCSASDGCSHWSHDYAKGVCTLYSGGSSSHSFSSEDGSVSGLVGRFNHWTSLPQAFKKAGWLTMGTGKVFHPEEGGTGPSDDLKGIGLPPNQDPQSWTSGLSMSAVNKVAPMDDSNHTCTVKRSSIRLFDITAALDCKEPSLCSCGDTGEAYAKGIGLERCKAHCMGNNDCQMIYCESPKFFDTKNCSCHQYRSCTTTRTPSGVGVHYRKEPSTCPVDAAMDGSLNKQKTSENDGEFEDKIIANDAILKLRLAAKEREETGRPFFLSVGFRKPHLTFRFPAPWLQYYPKLDQVPIAKQQILDPSIPPIAHMDEAFTDYGPGSSPYEPIDEQAAREFRLYYAATISWMDSQLGRVMTELESLGLTNSTVIAMHSDHGWSLGEQGEWQKFTNFELGARVPLIIRDPEMKAQVSDAVVELVDVMPTLMDLAGVPVSILGEEKLDGTSLAPIVSGQDTGAGRVGLSLYARCPNHNNPSTDPADWWKANGCLTTDRTLYSFMGLSLRTDSWRYTEWLRWDGAREMPSWSQGPVAVELYDHTGDDGCDFDAFENKNLAWNASVADVRERMAALLRKVYDAGTSNTIVV